MKCANCGKEINTSDTFCPYCGEQLISFGMQHAPGDYGDSDENSLTYIGSYEESGETDFTGDRTYLDSSGIPGSSGGTEDLTYLDSSAFHNRIADEDRTVYEPYGSAGFDDGMDEEMTGQIPAFQTADAFQGAQKSNTSPVGARSQNPAGAHPEAGSYRGKPAVYSPIPDRGSYEYQAPASGYRQESPKPAKKTGIIIAAVAVLLLLAVAAAFFLLRGRSPQLDTLSYDELVTEYGLSTGDSDDVRNAYYENVRFEFEDITKGNSGYKATAVIYTPDMEEIYGQTTVASEAAEKLKRLSEEDLDKNQKTVLLNNHHDGLTENSAKTLQEIADNRFMTVDEYSSQTAKSTSAGSSAAASSSQNTASNGNTSGANQSAAAPVQNDSGAAVQSQEAEASSSGVDSGAVLRLTGASATSTLYEKGYDHSPSNVLDGKLSTAWVEGASGQGIGEKLTVSLNGSFTISTMTINAGYQKSARLYDRNSRPKSITLFFSDGSSESVALADTNSTQTVNLQPVTTSSVTLQIDSVYAGSVYQDACISEIRFN